MNMLVLAAALLPSRRLEQVGLADRHKVRSLPTFDRFARRARELMLMGLRRCERVVGYLLTGQCFQRAVLYGELLLLTVDRACELDLEVGRVVHQRRGIDRQSGIGHWHAPTKFAPSWRTFTRRTHQP